MRGAVLGWLSHDRVPAPLVTVCGEQSGVVIHDVPTNAWALELELP